jgi:ABC-type branched-subunit amino acid transport system ATPase component/ABC-type branched-subunit amino acid transport system permease subunit
MNATATFEQTRTALADAAREARASWSTRATVFLLAVALALLAPAVLPLGDRMTDLAGFVYLAVAAVGLGYAVGLGGIPSLGQGAFVGIGAVVEANARASEGWPFLPSIFVAVVAAAAAGVLTGLATGRLRRAFVAVSTWILSWIVALALTSFPGISGGAQGLVLPGSFSPTAHYELGIVLLALAMLAFVVIAPRGSGLGLRAGRDDPAAAIGLGVPLPGLRLGVLTASAALAGLAGALTVELEQIADPSGYGPVLSFELFVAVIVGGARTPLGPVVGLLAISALRHLAEEVGGLRGLPPGRLEEMLTGYGLLVALAIGGAGIVPAAQAWLGRRRNRAFRPQTPSARPLFAVEAAGPLAALGLSKRFGNLVALEGLDLDLVPGTVHALVGPNGSGKTTALRAITGELRPDSGSVELAAEPLGELSVRDRVLRGVVGTQQTTAIFPDLSALENVLVGAGVRTTHDRTLRMLLQTPKARAEEAETRRRALGALAVAGLAGEAGRPAGELPAHARRRLMLAAALATGPRVLLLDEPAAGASAAELNGLAELLTRLRNSGLALLVIEHNLRFVGRVADVVTVLEAGRRLASGTLAEVAADATVRAAYLGRGAF